MAKPSSVEAALTNSVIANALARNGQLSVMGWRLTSKGAAAPGWWRREPSRLRSSGLVLRLEKLQLLLGDPILYLVVDGLQPFQEHWVRLVDGEAHVCRHLGALQAFVAGRER